LVLVVVVQVVVVVQLNLALQTQAQQVVVVASERNFLLMDKFILEVVVVAMEQATVLELEV
jgi:hypothetical protein